MILGDIQREMCEFPLEPYPYPAAFQRMSLQDQMNHLGQKNKAARSRQCWSTASDVFIFAESVQ